MTTQIGIQLTADDKELARVLKAVEGRLDQLELAARGSMAGTAAAANDAAAAVRNLEAQTGMSARQMQAALRQLPMQFTDIFTSLAAGQPPMMVLLQQGGQLKDTFGGIGPAARAMGGYIMGLVTPATVAAGALGVLAVAAYQGSEEAEMLARTLILTGNAAGATVGQLMYAAAAVRAMGAGTQGRAAEIINDMAAAAEVGTAQLARFTAAALQLERVGGPAAEETAKAFAALGKDPLKASIKLNESTNYLTASVYEQIKALQAQGRHVDASRVAMEAYYDAINQRTPQVAASMGKLERAMMFLLPDQIRGGFDWLKDVNRIETASERIQDLQRKIELTGWRHKREEYQAEIDMLSRRMLLQQESATAEAQRAAEMKARIKADEEAAKAAEKAATDAKRQAEEAAAAAKREGEARGAVMARLIGLNTDYAEQMARLNAMRAAGTLSEEQYTAAVQQLVAAQPFAEKAARERAKAEQALARVLADAHREREQHLRGIERGLQAGERQLEQLGDELARIKGGTRALDERVIRRLEDQAAALEAQARWAAADDAEAESLVAQARQLREQIKLRGQIAEATADKAASEAATRAWQRAAEDIERALTDALMRGFDSGRGFADSLRASVINSFKTMAVRVMVQPIMSGMQSMFGMPGAAGQSAGAGGGGSPIGALASLAGLSDLFRAGSAAAANGNTMGAMQAGWNMMKGGQIASGATFSAGAVLPQAAMAAAMWSVAKSIQNGYKLGGLSNDASTLLGGGVVARMFGRRARETRGSGITGTASAGGFAGQQYTDWFRKGGLFRSDKSGRDFAGVADDLDQTVDASIGMLYGSTEAYAKALGLPVEAARRYSGQFSVAWGQSEAENEKALQAALDKLREDLAGVYGASLAPLQRAGETLAQTLERLASLQTFSESLNSLGGVFSRLAGLTVSAREGFISLAGGMDALSQQAQDFVQNYYQRDEIAGLKARGVLGALTDAGFSSAQLAGLDSRDDFRALVEGVDLSTDAGQKQLATLLQLQGEFAQVADYLTESGGTLTTAALLAPNSAVLDSPVVGAQVEAINGVRNSIDVMADRVVDAITAGGGQWVTTGNGESENTYWMPSEVWTPSDGWNTSDGP